MRWRLPIASRRSTEQRSANYDPDADIAQLAAAYAFGIAMSHPYSDGNERTAFLVAAIFLEFLRVALIAGRLPCGNPGRPLAETVA